MSSAEKSPRPRRRVRRLLLGLFVLGLLIVGTGVWSAFAQVTTIARWAVQRAIPQVRVELGAVRFAGPSAVDFEKFVLHDKTSGAEVLRLDGGSIAFSFDGLLQSRIAEVRLVNPRLTASPGLMELLPKGGTSGGGGRTWVLERLVCDYGEFLFDGAGKNQPLVRGKFAFDWKGLGDAAAMSEPLRLAVWDVQASAVGYPAPFLRLDLVEVTASPDGLRNRQFVDEVKVTRGNLVVGRALEQIFSGPPRDAAAPLPAWKLAAFEIRDVAVRLDDGREEISDITFALNTTLRGVALGDTADTVGEIPQTIEIADLEVLSPLDPFTKVLTLRTIILQFRLAGLLRREIDEITILHPTIHVGPDLFWYMEDAQKRFGTNNGGTGGPGWKVAKLDVQFGRLVLGSGGRASYGLPLNFGTTVREVDLDNLAALQVEAALEIPAQDYEFESYQILVSTERGDLRFAYPPEKGEKNLVGKLFLRRVMWRQYEADEAWISATFDKQGINGDFGGKAYGGYVSGGFSFLFDARSPWIGWVYGKRVSLRQLTDVVAPQNFRMTGPVDFRVQMDAFGSRIERVKGEFRALKPGRLRISKLDDLLANIPDTWPALKQSSTRIALEALRDFDYDTATGDAWFVQDQGVAELRLQGPQGSRNFDVVLHADESQEGRWKQKP